MEPINQDLAPIRSALFVDFDNIYIGLSKTDPQAAERFASDPARWLGWLERGMPVHSGLKPTQLRPRSILIRRCYPNPDAGFRRFRSFYTSAAFSVIDCPSMTRTGKNSSDIYMVMDILDTLEHKTYFDEFIIFSGDSDFMPVLLRLRAHDRRTTTLAIDFMPPAYKAACDLVISEEDFIEEALGITHESGSSRARVSLALLKDMALRVYDATCQAGEVDGSDLPDILKDFREFRESTNWLGFGLSQRLAEALVAAEPRLHLIRLNATMYKLVLKPQSVKAGGSPAREKSDKVAPEKVEKSQEKNRPAAEKPAPEKPERSSRPGQPKGEKEASGEKEKPTEKPAKVDVAQLRAQILGLIKEIVTSSQNPVLLARVSQQIVTRLGPQVLDTQWAGAGSFKKLLQNAAELGLEVTTQPEPGYIFDPQRHPNPAQRDQNKSPQASEPLSAREDLPENGQALEENVLSQAEMEEEQPDLLTTPPFEMPEAVMPEVIAPLDLNAYPLDMSPEQYEEEEERPVDYNDEAPPTLDEFIRRVSRVTGAPDLTPEQYAIVFRGMVYELQQIASGEKSYTTYQSSKAVSEWCASHGSPVSRSDIVLIFKGIIFQDGVRFGKDPGSYTERELAEVVCSNIRALCQRSQLELSAYEDHLLDEWIIGDVDGQEQPGDGYPVHPPVDEDAFVSPAQGDTWAERSESESAWASPPASSPDLDNQSAGSSSTPGSEPGEADSSGSTEVQSDQ